MPLLYGCSRPSIQFLCEHEIRDAYSPVENARAAADLGEMPGGENVVIHVKHKKQHIILIMELN